MIDYPDGSRYRNRYDVDGRLSEVEFDNAGTWTDVAVNTYDDDGLVIAQDQGASGARAWTYDAVSGRMSGYADTRGVVTTTTTLTHDAAGRIATEATGATSTTYDYDDAGQLVLIDRNTGDDTTVAYDELGRRTTATTGATTTTYQWDVASQLTRRVVAGANHNYQYDASGRRVREAWNGGTKVLQWFWGVRGTMTGQRYTDGATVTDTARATRGDGSLASLTTTVNGTPTDTTDIVWDPTLAVAQPVWTGTPGGSDSTRAVYGPDLIRVTCPTGTGCTGPVPHDAYGSALRTTATSAVVQDNAYGRWGDGGGVFTAGARYGYRSELHTGATIHLRARDYDPVTGSFLSPDPLDGVDGTTTVANPYHCADNDPLNATDPLGLRPTDAAMAAPAILPQCADLPDLPDLPNLPNLPALPFGPDLPDGSDLPNGPDLPALGVCDDGYPDHLWRGGSPSHTNLTPRYPNDTRDWPANGLSTYDSLERACRGNTRKAQKLDWGRLRALDGLDLAQDSGDEHHWFLQADTYLAHLVWAALRNTPSIERHPLADGVNQAIAERDAPCPRR